MKAERICTYNGETETAKTFAELQELAEMCKRLPALYNEMQLGTFGKNALIDAVINNGKGTRAMYEQRANNERDPMRKDYYFGKLKRWNESDYQQEINKITSTYGFAKIRDLVNLLVVEKDKILIAQDAKSVIAEQNRIYITDKSVIEKFEQFQKACEQLTELFKPVIKNSDTRDNWHLFFDIDANGRFTMREKLNLNYIFANLINK